MKRFFLLLACLVSAACAESPKIEAAEQLMASIGAPLSGKRDMKCTGVMRRSVEYSTAGGTVTVLLTEFENAAEATTWKRVMDELTIAEPHANLTRGVVAIGVHGPNEAEVRRIEAALLAK